MRIPPTIAPRSANSSSNSRRASLASDLHRHPTGSMPAACSPTAPTANYQFQRTAIYVDKILKGRQAGGVAGRAADEVEFVSILKAAKQIGLTIPPNVLVRRTG